MNENTTPLRLIAKLIAYFLVLSVIISVLILNRPELLGFLPVGGTDVNESSTPADRDGEITESRLAQVAGEDSYFGGGQPSIDSVWRMVIFLVLNLASTILVMLPITWTYLAKQYDSGPSKAFVRALIILPICVCTVVLLIQDSLALAFGFAALMAAVRFRVTLRARGNRWNLHFCRDLRGPRRGHRPYRHRSHHGDVLLPRQRDALVPGLWAEPGRGCTS